MSIARALSAAPNRPGRSVSPPRHHRRCVAWRRRASAGRQHSLGPFFHQLPPRAGDGRAAGVQGGSDPAKTSGFSDWRGVRLQQNARLRQLLRQVLAAVDQVLQPLSLVRAELHDILLYGDFSRDREPAPTFIAETSILTFYSLSMTQGTSPHISPPAANSVLRDNLRAYSACYRTRRAQFERMPKTHCFSWPNPHLSQESGASGL
jgi:hypothetical protein